MTFISTFPYSCEIVTVPLFAKPVLSNVKCSYKGFAFATITFIVAFLSLWLLSPAYVTANSFPVSVASPTDVVSVSSNVHPSGNCAFTSASVCPYIAVKLFGSCLSSGTVTSVFPTFIITSACLSL